YRSFNEAAEHFTAGTETEPMRVYIAPFVYWIDDPDDTEIKRGKDGREPFGLIVKCPYLHLIGLNDNPRNVVLASRRGQTQGVIGNFTMFDFWGDGLVVKNLTMGNFCNVDLEYPLKPELSREKRNSAITQAHVAYCHCDRIYAENVHFISRLNMNPLNGAKRILFNKCHMESTDDALTGTGVYLDCTLHFYGERPFWRSDMGGAVFLNSDFYVKHDGGQQYFCKAVGPLSIVDCRYHTDRQVYAGWTAYPTDWLRCYQYHVQMNGQPYVIGSAKPYNTLCMEQTAQLNAYRVEVDGEVVYNTYNLLRGDDGWDPMNVKEKIEAAGRKAGKDYTRMATCLSVTPLEKSLRTGEAPLKLTAAVKGHCNYVWNNVPVKWKVQPGFEKYVKLSAAEGYECVVEATNHEDETKRFTVIASTDDGLEGAVELTVSPDFIDSPAFLKAPQLKIEKGRATVEYALDLQGRADQSLITWYRCTDKNGADAIPVSVSRLDEPAYTYDLRKEDVGYYLMVGVAPKHVRSLPGEEVRIVSKTPMKRGKIIDTHVYETDFRNFPTRNQPRLIPGFWTVDGYKPIDTAEYDWQVDMSKDYWIYGKGFNGARGFGLLQDQKGARLLYTPLEGKYGDMEVSLYVDPTKMAGQGFGSATGQYMDVYIKFDTQTLTGYALRVIRTTKFSNAVDFLLVEYKDGQVTPLTAPISAICYRTGCIIRLKVEDDVFTAHVETETPLPPIRSAELLSKVDLDTRITPNTFGGTGVQHTGSCGESTTMLKYLKVEWK
ncbi:MAG: hypothetical protein IJ456_04810, partial [Bacteroides sp.]|nr:hypothetical protein [Bacteroides sp.]